MLLNGYTDFQILFFGESLTGQAPAVPPIGVPILIVPRALIDRRRTL